MLLNDILKTLSPLHKVSFHRFWGDFVLKKGVSVFRFGAVSEIMNFYVNIANPMIKSLEDKQFEFLTSPV